MNLFKLIPAPAANCSTTPENNRIQSELMRHILRMYSSHCARCLLNEVTVYENSRNCLLIYMILGRFNANYNKEYRNLSFNCKVYANITELFSQCKKSFCKIQWASSLLVNTENHRNYKIAAPSASF